MFSSSGTSPHWARFQSAHIWFESLDDVRKNVKKKKKKNPEQVPPNRVLWDGVLRCSKYLSQLQKEWVSLTTGVMSLSVLTAFPSTGSPRGLVYSAGSSQPSTKFWDQQFACLRLPCKRPRIKHTFNRGWLGCCRSAEPFGQWPIMLIPKASRWVFISGSARALNLGGMSDSLGNLNMLRRPSWGAYCLRSLWASRTCLLTLLAFPSKGKPAPPWKASQSYPGAEKVIKRFFVSKSRYPKRVNRGSWDGNKVRTRGDWLEAAWGKQNHKTVCRTGRPGLLQSMGAIMSPTGLSNWTELREVRAGNLPMSFTLIILSSSPVSFLWVVSSSAPLLVSFPGSLCNCFSTSNT